MTAHTAENVADRIAESLMNESNLVLSDRDTAILRRHLRAFAEANHPAQGDWSAEAAAKEAWAAYVKPVMVPNHPLPEPPVRWMIAVVPALQAAHDANRPAPPGGIVEAEAIEHLRNVLMVLAELSPDDRCQALDDALEFYNDHRPNAKIEPIEGFVSRLVNFTPMDRAMGTEVKSVTMESGENSAALPPTTLADVPAQEREAVRWALEHTIHRFPTSDGSDKLRSFLTRLDPKP